MKIQRLLAARGIHFLVTRFGSRELRKLAFDEKYRGGDWRFNRDSSGELPDIVRHYLCKGNLLIMGCGGASILSNFACDEFTSVLGIDLSEEAIRIASTLTSSRISFQVSDMEHFVPERHFNVILFSESLYYVHSNRQIALLRRLANSLESAGVFVVTLAQPKRYKDILARIRTSFTVLEDRSFPNSNRHLVVFR